MEYLLCQTSVLSSLKIRKAVQREKKYTDLRRREAMVDNIEEAVVRHRVARLLCKSQTTFWSGSLR
jgi:hypothetical protein